MIGQNLGLTDADGGQPVVVFIAKGSLAVSNQVNFAHEGCFSGRDGPCQ
jgi:hypothetical protein